MRPLTGSSKEVRSRGQPGDDAGHIIARRFGADFNLDTAVPQNSNFNRGAYRKMEDFLAEQVNSGKTVEVDVQLVYSGDSKRPDKFIVNAVVDGQPESWSFLNAPGGR